MKGHGPKHERETIIRFDDESDKAEIWTAGEPVYRRLLKRLGRAYLTEDGERHAVFTFPAEFLQLPRARAKKVLSPEKRLNWQTAWLAAHKLWAILSKAGLI